MTPRQISLTLRYSARALWGAAAVVAICGIMLPLRHRSSEVQASRSAPGRAPAAGPMALPPLESFAGIWAHPLRRPLGDPQTDAATEAAATAAQAKAAAAAPLPFTLAGTIGTSLAMLRGPNGDIALRSIGEQIGGVEVIAIRPSQVDIRYQGRTVTLEKAGDGNSASMIHGMIEPAASR